MKEHQIQAQLDEGSHYDRYVKTDWSGAGRGKSNIYS